MHAHGNAAAESRRVRRAEPRWYTDSTVPAHGRLKTISAIGPVQSSPKCVRLATWRTHMQSTDSSSITSSIVTQNGWCSLRKAQISLLRFCRFASAFVASFMSPDSET